MNRVFLSLGSNLGNRLQYLSDALCSLKNVVRITAMSSVYETEPVGMNAGEWFYNVVADIQTELSPASLLHQLKDIEASLGRAENTHWKPREIDLDIVLYDGYIYRDEVVEVPHPRMMERKFILEPLTELAPDILHPVERKTIETLRRECPDRHEVKRTSYLLNISL